VVAKQRLKTKVLMISAGLVLGCALGYYLMPTLAHSIASYLAYPVLLVQHKYVTPLKQLFARKRERQLLETMVTQLQTEKEELNGRLVELQATTDYATHTQELAAFKKRYDCSYAVMTQVLMWHITDQAHSIIIDAGSNKGVQKDMVAVYNNMLLGRVIEVYPHYSKVVLITDASCKVAAYCVGTQTTGIHAGLNQTAGTVLHHVSHLLPLQENDMVLSSGEGLVFPRGFGLGRIKKFTLDGLLYHVDIEPLCDITQIQHCYVLQKGNEFALRDDPNALDSTMTTTDAAVPADAHEPVPYRGVDRARVRR
jgi:rod shape-determining protein MreC